MNNTQFWGANSDLSQTNNSNIPSYKVSKGKTPSKKWLKGLGATGVILMVVLGIVSFVGYLYVIKPAYAMYSTFNTLKNDASSIGSALQSRDLVALNDSLDNMQKDLEKAREQREESFGWAKEKKIFKINEFYSDSDRFINAANYGIEALREMSVIVTPFADAAGLKVTPDQEVPEQEGLMEAFQSWVSLMPEVAGQMDGVIVKVSKIGEELEPVNVDKYPEKIRGIAIRDNIRFIKDTLSGADEYAPDLKLALQIFPKVLAVGTPEKRYMIIMQNDKEIRATGGFMTNYATFKIREGLLQSDFSSKDMYSIDLTLDLIDATYDFPDAPKPYPDYLKVERWYARDMNYSPDFVTSMDQFLKFYNMAGRLNPTEIKPVDGIVAINTQVIEELLEVTGPVTVNGITYTKDNVVLELERIASLELREQANRKKVLGDLMEAMLINVFESDKNLWSKLIEKGVDLSTRKHILVYLFDPEAQALVEKYNLGGRITEDVKGDYSMVVSTNLGGDKTNWFTEKEVNHSLEKVNDKWLRTVRINYKYTEPGAEYSPFVKRFKDWVRLYAPVGSELLSADGFDGGMLTDQERNKVWFSGYLELGPGESKEVVFKYYLPDEYVGKDEYSLTIQKQPGIDSEKHVVSAFGKTSQVDLLKDIVVKIK